MSPTIRKNKVALRWRMYRILTVNGVRQIKTYFKGVTLISNHIIEYNIFRHSDHNKQKMPDALGSVADPSHRV